MMFAVLDYGMFMNKHVITNVLHHTGLAVSIHLGNGCEVEELTFI